MSALFVDAPKTKCAALRELLSDGQWHHMQELRRVGGWRYGARLLESRRGEDGGYPFQVEKRQLGSASEWEYRQFFADELPLSDPRAKRSRKQLQADNAKLITALKQYAAQRCPELGGAIALEVLAEVGE